MWVGIRHYHDDHKKTIKGEIQIMRACEFVGNIWHRDQHLGLYNPPGQKKITDMDSDCVPLLK